MVSLLTEARIQTEMRLFKDSLDLAIMTIFQENLKIDFLNSIFLKSTKNSREVTGYSFNHVPYTLCILEMAQFELYFDAIHL